IMNPQETQVVVRDENWVPFTNRVKISSTNAFTISVDVPEIFMQQFWTILDIYPRVEDVNFTNVPDDDPTLAFLIKLGYKGLLYKHTNMFVDHMHHPWRTLAEYGLPIPETMLTEAIKQSESYQMFIKYSTGQIPPKKNRGKGSQGKKIADTHVADVVVAKESDPEPARKKTSTPSSSKRRVKKKVTLSADDNIISNDPNAALELGKVTSDPPKKLKGVPSLTQEEQKAIDIMQALKESKKPARDSQALEAQMKELGLEQESEYSKEDQLDDEEKDDKDDDADDEGNDHISDAKYTDDEDDEIEYDEDEIYKYKIHVHKDDDEEMLNAEVEDSDKGFGDQFLKLSSDSSLVSIVKDTIDEEINSLLEVKIQSEDPHIQYPSMLRVPVSMISKPTVLTLVQETSSAAPVTTLPLPSVSTTPTAPLQQTTTPIPTPPIITDAPTITTNVSESDALSTVQLRVAKLEKDVSELKKINLSSEALAALKTQVKSIVDNYLGSKVGDAF
ncbi:hypothetical protein Tco_1159111, partial [Tanacetum coccineum]